MNAIRFVQLFAALTGAAVTVLYAYQMVYLAVGLLHRERGSKAQSGLRRYAALISARDEAEVIAQLIDSLKRQNYPNHLLDVFVVADNCTDQTAAVAQAAGAIVYRRFDKVRRGKGYALDYLLRAMADDGFDRYDAYMVFDADNIVDPDFVSQMDRTFSTGKYDAVTCYRNSKNFGRNWITAGYSIWFLREARFVNNSRQALGLSCAVSGTGFLISADVIRSEGGWPWHLLTEDIQFSAQCMTSGKTIGYCAGAVIYDEQPTSFRQSWDQRLRWSKGFYQVCGKYGGELVKGILRGGRLGMSCYDLLMTVAPGVLLSVFGGAANLVMALGCLAASAVVVKGVLMAFGAFLWSALSSFYLGMLLYGLVTVTCEWRRIKAKSWQKIVYLFTFPVFMATYIPISIVALFQKVEWKPIRHTAVNQLDMAA